MTRNSFLTRILAPTVLFSLALSSIAGGLLAAESADVAAPEKIVLQSSSLSLTLVRVPDADRDGRWVGVGVESLVDSDGTSYLDSSAPSSLFTLEVRPAGSKEVRRLDSLSGWSNVTVTDDAGRMTFRFSGPVLLGESSLDVFVTLSATADDPEIRLSWRGETKNDSWAFWRGQFPNLNLRRFAESVKTFYPAYSGIVRDDLFTDQFRYQAIYPNGWNGAMSWLAVWDAAKKTGLYLCAADSEANLKVFALNGETATESAKFSVDTPFPNMGVAGNSFVGAGNFVLRGFSGDWYDAARIYKKWVAAEAVWYPELGPDGRPDVPEWMKENSVFLMVSSDDRWLTPNRRVYTPLSKMDAALAEFRDAVGIGGAVHWYLWHQNPYDNDYPHFFPAKEGFAEKVLEVLDRADFRVMPYTNGRLWDTKDRGSEDWKFTSEGKAGALKREDGSLVTETYALPSSGKEADGSPCVHAAMCPASAIWQKTVRENVLTAMNGHNTTGVYIDQVGASTPFPCFDPSHGHPIGGGHWWLSEGYGKLFQTIRRDMKQTVSDIPLNPELAKRVEKNPELLTDRIITTECNAEVYANRIDGFLTWHWQDPNQVPAFPVVYGGAVSMFGRCSTGEPLSVMSRVSQALVWGEQIGWFDPSVCHNDEMFPFIKDAILCRHAVREYFYKGEMRRPPVWMGEMPTVTSDWLWGGKPNTHTEPAVQASCWRIAKRNEKGEATDETEKAILLFSNVSDKEVTLTVQFDAEEIGLAGRTMTIRRMDAQGAGENLPADTLDRPITFSPRKSFALELLPSRTP